MQKRQMFRFPSYNIQTLPFFVWDQKKERRVAHFRLREKERTDTQHLRRKWFGATVCVLRGKGSMGRCDRQKVGVG